MCEGSQFFYFDSQVSDLLALLEFAKRDFFLAKVLKYEKDQLKIYS